MYNEEKDMLFIGGCKMKRQQKYPDTETFHWYNANPKGRIGTGDCLIRAIAGASDLSWDEVLDGLVAISHKTKRSIGDDETYRSFLESIGFTQMRSPKKENGQWYTGAEFCYALDKYMEKPCSIVANVHGHVVCIRQYDCLYKVWDTWNSTPWKIGKYWIKYL